MITRQEAIRRLGDIAKDVEGLKAALEEGWSDRAAQDPTTAFLEKCGGWEDSRSPEEIVAEVYSARTISRSAASLFSEK